MNANGWSTLADLRSQVQRHWDKGRLPAGAVTTESLFPLQLKLRGPNTRACSERFEEVRRWIRELESERRYRIEWVEFNHRVLGRNRIPARIVVPGECEALSLIDKTDEFHRFRALYSETVKALPELAEWLVRRPLIALENADEWVRVMPVLLWFRSHPQSGLYLRQLDIAGVDTKFIERRRMLLDELLSVVLPAPADEALAGFRHFEQRYGLAGKPLQIRFRLLDARLVIQSLTDLAVPVEEFAALELPIKRVFITENEINGLSFPTLPGSVVIFGLGYGLERLSRVDWLRRSAFYYWGDIDTHGFHILDRLRMTFPNAQSLFMDSQTLLEHVAVWGREETQFRGELNRLTEAEGALYEDLKYNRLGNRVRLEQERVRFGWVESGLCELPD